MKSRFQQEISGELGSFWQNEAESELLKLNEELNNGSITIDEFGIVRNKIGRVVMQDMLEKLMYIAADRINEEATKAAYDEEVTKSIEKYIANYKGPSAEELAEMRANFNPSTTVVNLFTGDKITV